MGRTKEKKSHTLNQNIQEENSMPINKKKMNALKKEYGKKNGENIYYALEQKKKNKK